MTIYLITHTETYYNRNPRSSRLADWLGDFKDLPPRQKMNHLTVSRRSIGGFPKSVHSSEAPDSPS